MTTTEKKLGQDCLNIVDFIKRVSSEISTTKDYWALYDLIDHMPPIIIGDDDDDELPLMDCHLWAAFKEGLQSSPLSALESYDSDDQETTETILDWIDSTNYLKRDVAKILGVVSSGESMAAILKAYIVDRFGNDKGEIKIENSGEVKFIPACAVNWENVALMCWYYYLS